MEQRRVGDGLQGKDELWEFVLELISGSYGKLDEHPFVWMGKPGVNIRSRIKEDAEAEREGASLQGVWKRLLLM